MRRRLSYISCAVIIIITFLLSFLQYRNSLDIYQETSESLLKDSMGSLLREVYRYESLQDPNLRKSLTDSASSFHMYLEFYNTKKEKIAEFGPERFTLAKVDLSFDKDFSFSKERVQGKDYLFYQQYLSERKIYARTAIPMNRLGDLRINFILTFLILSLLGSLLAIILVRIFSKRIINQLKNITRFNQSILLGGDVRTLYQHSIPEISALTTSLNDTMDYLQQQKINQKKRIDSYENVFNSLPLGIAYINKNEIIEYMNEEMIHQLSIDVESICNSHYLRVFSTHELIEALNIVLVEEKTKELVVDFSHQSRSLQAVVKKVEMASEYAGILLIVRDISSNIQAKKQRKDLIDNLSHELRTPLTSIIGFLETLQNTQLDENTREKFLNITIQEAHRLNELVQDITQLNEIEKKERKIRNRNAFSPNEVIHQTSPMLESIAKKKNVEFILLSEKSEGMIFGSTNQFSQLLINLVDNGVKYSKNQGHRYVRLSTKIKDQRFYLIVEDNGIGIEKSEQERIFERFYQVDKVRNSNREGSGLGLSIVKHIVLSLNGTIELQSEKDVGSKFTIIIPLINLQSLNFKKTLA